jgi:hypothetical protein
MTKDPPAHTIGYLVVTQGPKPTFVFCQLEGRPYVLVASGPEAYQTLITQGTPRTRVAPAAVMSGLMNRASSVVGREETLLSERVISLRFSWSWFPRHLL